MQPEQGCCSRQDESEVARLAAHCSSTDWHRIKSAGRQGVLRAYREGGARKAAIKLAKMLAAADSTTSTAPAAVPGAGNAKKRRRRANQRERVATNSNGALTSGQLFWLFGAQSSSWERITQWRQLPVYSGRHPARKVATREAWLAEFSLFQVNIIIAPAVDQAQFGAW